MTSSKNPIYLKLVLVGDPNVGKSTLCRTWNPGFGPMDGYHIYHSNNILQVEVPDINIPPYSSPPDNSLQTQPSEIKTSKDVSLYIMITQPRQEGDHTKLTPYVMMNTDVVGLCYTPSSAKTLENAVNVWLPFIKHHTPSTPIVLIGYHADTCVPKISAILSEEAAKGIPPVLPPQLQNAISQTNAVHALEWSPRITREGSALLGPRDVAQVLAWYGCRYSMNSAKSAKRHCIIA